MIVGEARCSAAPASLPLRFAYADPPYPGQAKRHYGKHRDYAGEVDHKQLVSSLREFDGWALSTSAPALAQVLRFCPRNVRVAAWCKRDSEPPGRKGTWWWSWEPVILFGGRPPHAPVRDVMAGSQLKSTRITGEKPYEFCAWIFRLSGLQATDEFIDLFPGSGAVTEAWQRWAQQTEIAMPPVRNLRPFERVKGLRDVQQKIADV